MKTKNKAAVMRRWEFTRQFYRGNVWPLVLAVVQTLIMVVVNLVISWILQQITDLAGGNDTGFSLGQLALIALACVITIVAACGLAYISKPRFLSKAMEQYQNFVFGELSKKSISAFNGENTSVYISALSNDANTIETDYLINIFSLLDDILLFFGGLAMMFWYSPMLTGISIALAFLPVVASILAGNRMAEAEKRVSARNETFMSTLKDSLTGFSVVKSFRAEAQMCRLFARQVHEVAQEKTRKRKLSVLIQLFSVSAGVIAQLGVFLAGAWLASRDEGISAGVVVLFIQLMNYVINPIGTVPQNLAGRKAAMALIDKLAKALAGNVRDQGCAIPDRLEQGIAVEHLSFAYDETPVLRDVTFRFEAGKRYAVVGTSGSGKSTLLNLLMASHGNYTGTIRYDGKELREISTESLYELVSTVQQNVFVFNASIRDNITMFSQFPAEEVERAIKLSGLDALIEPRGDSYICGENGSGLSGGEKQRLSIARSLLRRSQVLLVDEATAALDSRTAYHVTDSILNLTGLTRIVVTHSLDEALLRRYDGILTLKNGQIVESGTFEALMEKKGYFYSLFTVSQT